MKKPSILIVEDESIIAIHIKKILKLKGYGDVNIASTEDEVFIKIKNTCPALILMDIILNGSSDGINIVEKIKTQYDVPIIYITAHSDEATINRAKTTEPYGFIVKPINKYDLYTAIEIALYKHSMERKLRISEEKYRNLIESINDIVYSTDESGTISFISKQVEALIGYSSYDLIGRPLVNYIFNEDAAQVTAMLVDNENMRVVDSIECRIMSQQEVPIWVRISGRPIYVNDEFNGIKGIITDITARKKAEEEINKKNEELAKSEATLKSILKAAPTGIGMTRERVLLWTNKMIEEMTGFNEDELVNKSSRVLYPSDEDFNYVGREKYGQIGRNSRGTVETRWQRKDGTIIDILLSSTPIDPDDLAKGVIFTALDMTERKRVEAAFQESEERHRTIFQESADATMIITKNIILDCNKAALELFGLPDKETLVGLHPAEIAPEIQPGGKISSEKVNTMIEMAYEKGNNKFELLSKKNDGTGIFVEILLTAFQFRKNKLLQAVIRNITEQKKTELAMHESEEQYRHIFNSVADGIAIADFNGTIIEVNPVFCEIHGYSREEAIGMTIKQFVSEEYWHVLNDFINTVIDGNVFIGETVDVRKDGNKINADIKGTPIKIKGNSFILAMVRDITEKRKAEIALRESERIYRSIFEGSIDGIGFVDMSSRFVDCNQSFLKMLGYTKDELFTKTLYDITPEKWHTWEKVEKIEKHLLVEGYTGVYEKEYIRKDGSAFPIEMAAYKLDGEYGKPTLLWGVVRDISDRKKYDEQLNRLATAVEQATEDIVLTDVDGRIQYVNPAFEKITGYSKEEVIGRTPSFLKSGTHDNIFYQNLWDTISSGNTWKARITNKTKEGSFIIQDANISPIRDTVGIIIGYVAVKRDVSEQVKMESQLVQAQKMEAIGNLAGGLAHDFNNVLGGIVGSLDLLELLLEKEDLVHRDKVWRYIRIALEASSRASDMIKQLLTLSRKQELKFAPVNINMSLNNVKRLCQSTFPKSIFLKFSLSDKPMNVNADPTQMEQVILNLCVNASHAMTIMRKEPEKEGGILSVEIQEVLATDAFCAGHPEAIEENLYIRISVSDTGVGMTEEIKKRIFEPFFTTKDKEVGTGLGLAMVYNIIKQHKGFIDINSEVGKGTAVNIYLPKLMKQSIMQSSVDGIKKIITGQGLILVIDDEPFMLQIAEDMLMHAGYTVITADNGEKGIKIFEVMHSEINAILLDLAMPGMAGFDVYIKLKEIDAHVKVLMTSGFPQDDRVKKAIKHGVNGFLKKPFSAPELSEKLKEVLES